VKVATQGRRFESTDLLIGATIVLIIGLTLFLVIYLRARKKSDRIDQKHLAQMTKSSSNTSASAEGGERRRKRRRRRAHRQRNPSFGQTRGPPPLRPDGQLPKD